MRIRALIIRIVRQFSHDKRTLALMILAPILILWMVSLIFHGSTFTPKIGAVHVSPPITAQLTRQGATVTTYASSTTAKAALIAGKVDATIQIVASAPHVVLEGSDPARSKVTLLLLQRALQIRNLPQGTMKAPFIQYLYGSDAMSSFDSFGPVLIGVFAFFFVFLIAGIVFLKERTSGTLERLMATPLRRWEIVIGYISGFGIFTTIQACLIAWFSIDVLGIMMNGKFIDVLIVTLFLSLTALTLGTFLSAFANTEFQMIQFIPLVIVPQIFFSGLFSLDNMVPWIQGLSKLMPLYYGADALKNIMIRGKGIAGIYPDILILFGLALVFMWANVLALRKYRRL